MAAFIAMTSWRGEFGVILSGEFGGARVAYLGTDRDLEWSSKSSAAALRAVARNESGP